ncbi:MAG TPA: 2Fe-2S iron-sulfur cluster-binding protein [Caulobacteraceae bacterium]
MSAQRFRRASGGRIDRARPLAFEFDGARYTGYGGDTLASALLANGVRITGRSFRFHRPRGVMAAGIEDVGAIVQLGEGAWTEPNLKATEICLADGLKARSVNAWPNARFDLGGALDACAALLPVGFYYKTFMWPRWGLFSGAIRRAGGLGRAPSASDPDTYAKTFAHCDVLVVGGGPAGIAAALAAGRAGARVVLVDDQSELGGSLLGASAVIDGAPAMDWVERSTAELERFPTVRMLLGVTASGYYDHNLVTLVEARAPQGRGPKCRLWKLRAARVVLATGAIERPLVFPNNDRPGVMLAGAAAAYAVRFGVLPGRTAVIATTNDSAYHAALDLLDAGMSIAAITDVRHSAPAIARQLELRGVQVLAGWAPVDTNGRAGLSAVTLAPMMSNGAAVTQAARSVACDLLAVSGGWNPAVQLFSQSGGRLAYDARQGCFAPSEWTQAGEAAGAAAGDFTLAGALTGGAMAGANAAMLAGFATAAAPPPATDAYAEDPPAVIWEIESDRHKRAWVDLLNDVTSEDIRLAARENYRSVEHLKRYTTLGMAVDQGKTGNVAGIGVLSGAIGQPIPAIGTTKFRPPFNPVAFGGFAGRSLHAAWRPQRRLPTHAAQAALGAALEDYGGWLRPAFYPRGLEGEEAAVRREVLAAHRGVGIFDASPLGKILVSGRDAGALLDRICVGVVSTLKVGRARYGVMLNEHGAIMDDGIVSRLDASTFLVGTTSAHANTVALWLEEWLQCEWPTLDVVIEPVTGEWTTINVLGPSSLEVMRRLFGEQAVSDGRLPHMAVTQTRLMGEPCRIARVSFSGERSYEISAPADLGEALWEALIDAGRPSTVAPIGVEAIMRMRLEKGFLHVGVDTDSSTYPQDLGLARLLRGKSGDFIGRRSTMRSYDGPRRQLVGVEALDPSHAIPLGAHVIDERSAGARPRSQGWVTSSGFGPRVGRHVALALVEDGMQRVGEAVSLFDGGARMRARLRPVCSFDPKGERLNA